MAPRDVRTVDTEQMVIDMGTDSHKANEYQLEKLESILRTIDTALREPQTGHLLWKYLSQFTPGDLRNLIQSDSIAERFLA